MTWADEIAAISESPEFQNATIRVEDPSLVVPGEYNPDTNEYEPDVGDPLLYEGRARIIPIREGSFNRNEDQANPTTLVPIRVQIPRTAATDIRIRRGCKVFVTEASGSLTLQDRMFTVTDDIPGSSAASRTFTAMADVDAYLEVGGYGASEALRDGYGE